MRNHYYVVKVGDQYVGAAVQDDPDREYVALTTTATAALKFTRTDRQAKDGLAAAFGGRWVKVNYAGDVVDDAVQPSLLADLAPAF